MRSAPGPRPVSHSCRQDTSRLIAFQVVDSGELGPYDAVAVAIARRMIRTCFGGRLAMSNINANNLFARNRWVTSGLGVRLPAAAVGGRSLPGRWRI